jgi:hypothetical protein
VVRQKSLEVDPATFGTRSWFLGLRPAAGDKIHTLITAMDADSNNTVEFDELASTQRRRRVGGDSRIRRGHR